MKECGKSVEAEDSHTEECDTRISAISRKRIRAESVQPSADTEQNSDTMLTREVGERKKNNFRQDEEPHTARDRQNRNDERADEDRHVSGRRKQSDDGCDDDRTDQEQRQEIIRDESGAPTILTIEVNMKVSIAHRPGQPPKAQITLSSADTNVAFN
jgi:hypothetical protein